LDYIENLKHEGMKLKASKYNVSTREGANSYHLINTLTSAVLRLQESKPTPVHSALLEDEAPFNYHLDKKMLDVLLSNGFLVPIDYDELKWLEDIHWKSRVGQKALGIGVAVTMGCDFRCTYCYQNHKNLHLSPQLEDSIIKYVAAELEGKSLLRVMWFGGEPLLRFKTICKISHKLLELTQAKNIEYDAAITTNGYLLTPARSKILRNLGVNDVQVTLDGPPSIHDKRRVLANGKPTFQTIFSNLAEVARTFSRVIVRINIDKRNQDEILKLLEILYPLRNWIQLAFRPATSPDTPMVEESWCIPPDSYWQLDNDFCNAANKCGFSIIRGYSFPGTSFCSGYQKNSVTIDPYGDVHRCPICIGRRNQRYGLLTTDGEIVIEKGFQKQWDEWSPFIDDECRDCKALPVCMGGCLWYINKEKSESFRCFARKRLAEHFVSQIRFGGIRTL
jgi:uncharacterized protein